jgi:excisionase family DNA binding protein
MVNFDVQSIVADLTPLVSAAEAAKFLKISPRTLRRWVNKGKLRVMRTSPTGSGRVLVARTELAALLVRMAEPVAFQLKNRGGNA